MRDAIEKQFWNPVMAAIEKHATPGMTMFDVGANRGLICRTMSRCAARVVAFEPLAQCADEIRRLDFPNVQIVQSAVSDIVGDVTFFVDERKGLGMEGSSLKKIGELKSKSAITVPVTTIDMFVAESAIAPDFIKIDVEGCEERVLVGAMSTIASRRPYLIFEVWGHNWPRFEDVLPQLKRYYRFERVSNGADALEEYSRQVITENDDILCIPL